MDAHTARCLQLSTSINPPFNGPYRHNRFDSMNRSRYNPQQQTSQHQQQQHQQQQQQQQQMRRPMAQRASSMPAVYRNPAAMQQSVFKQPFSQQAMLGGNNFIHGMSPADISPSNSSNYDTTSLFSSGSNNVSPNTPFGADTTWDPSFGIDMKQMQKAQEGLGMSFMDGEIDFSNPFGVQSDGLDLIHLSEHDHQLELGGHAMSPDRRSVSSESSGDNVAEMHDMAGEHADVLSQDIPMPTVEEEVHPASHGRARHSRSNSRAPAPRASSTRRYRRAPYSMDAGSSYRPFEGHRRSSSVMSTASSIGSCAPMSMPVTQCCSPVNECHDDFSGLTDFSGLDFGSHGNVMADDVFTVNPMAQMHHAAFGADLIAPQPKYATDQLLFHGFEDPLFDHKAPVLPSSHVPNEHPLHSHVDEFADYAEEPDLFGALSEEQSVPSEEDMNPEDESMKPQEQDTRFEGDLYTPRFVRGTGVHREGYCGLCKPGRWLVLKNSAFWYDKSFTHGISAATGQPFDGPKETRRMSGNPDVWEGLCGCCNEWIALISNKKKGTTWFRHAYKCHNHNKNKDGAKKKGASKAAQVKKEEKSEACCSSDIKSNESQAHQLQTLGSFF